MKRQILMTRENPKGHKLEDLLKKLRFELTLKTLRLVGDPHPLSKTIMARNKMILMQLERCQALQETNMAECEAFFSRPSSATEPRLGVNDNVRIVGATLSKVESGDEVDTVEDIRMLNEMSQMDIVKRSVNHDGSNWDWDVTDFGQEFIDWMRG